MEKALQSVCTYSNFNGTYSLQQVWDNQSGHVNSIHQEVIDHLVREMDGLQNTNHSMPLIQAIFGEAGSGKTHLLGRLRQKAVSHGAFFVLCDLIDTRGFWHNLLHSFLFSLNQPHSSKQKQIEWLMDQLFESIPPYKTHGHNSKVLNQSKEFKSNLESQMAELRKSFPCETLLHADTLRALLLIASHQQSIRDVGMAWLQGLPLPNKIFEEQGFHIHSVQIDEYSAAERVSAISWVMGLVAPTVIGFEQLDILVHQYLNAQSHTKPLDTQTEISKAQYHKAAHIIHETSSGLIGAWDKLSPRTLMLVTCLNKSWGVLSQVSARAWHERFDTPLKLKDLGQQQIEELITQRLLTAYQKLECCPPYPTYPFSTDIIKLWGNVSARQILLLCSEHIAFCVKQKQLIEKLPNNESLSEHTEASLGINSNFPHRDTTENELSEQQNADRVENSFQEKVFLMGHNVQKYKNFCQEYALGNFIRNVLVVYGDQYHSNHFKQAVKIHPNTVFSNANRFLHGQLKISIQEELINTFSFRALSVHHPKILCSRIISALEKSGLNKNFQCNRLLFLHFDELPSNDRVINLQEKVKKLGGQFYELKGKEIMELFILSKYCIDRPNGFESWLRIYQPVSRLKFMKSSGLLEYLTETVNFDYQKDNPSDEVQDDGSKVALHNATSTCRLDKRNASNTPELSIPNLDNNIPTLKDQLIKTGSLKKTIRLGYRKLNGVMQPYHFKSQYLKNHIFITAGAGYGKTVLMRRIIEEAAIHHIPSIIFDSKNEMSRSGIVWDDYPELFTGYDAKQSKMYFDRAETVIWTPGVHGGNPISFGLLPTLNTLLDDEDELNRTIHIIHKTLNYLIINRKDKKARLKEGILMKALRNYSMCEEQSLSGFLDYLRSMPKDVLGDIQHANRLANEMADALWAEISTNQLIQQESSSHAFSRLFNTPSDKVRVSVVNLSGVNALKQRQLLFNQFVINMIIWMKKHPAQGSKPRGLIVIDEVQEYIPSQVRSLSKHAFHYLTVQAQRYGYSLILSTKDPVNVEQKVVDNIRNHFYGKFDSGINQEDIISLWFKKLYDGSELSTLQAGEFYLSTENYKTPFKVKTPLCLSYHSDTPLTDSEVKDLAQYSQQLLKNE